MRRDQKLGGTMPPRGQLHLRVRRDLGDLTIHRPPHGFIRSLTGAIRARFLADDRPENKLAAWRFGNLLRRIRQGDGLPIEARIYLGRLIGVLPVTGSLSLRHYRPGDLAPDRRARLDGLLGTVPLEDLVRAFGGNLLDYGLVSRQVITTAGVEFLTDAFQDTVEIELMNFHGIGLGGTGPVIGDTALETELTTQYNPDNTRATGVQSEAAPAIYRTVGTNTVDATVALLEHGILSQAAVGGGTLWDRSIFSVINLVNGDSLESTYDMTSTAGG